MSNHKNRVEKLESKTPLQTASRMSDEARMNRIKQLSAKIVREARAQGVTPQDDPALKIPFAIVEVLEKYE